MEVRLKICVGSSAGQELRIPTPKFFVGRAEDCHLRPKSDMISRHHCVIMIDESSVVIRDLGSRNGTLVNSERVIGERELKAGDNLRIGPLEFEVVIVETSKKRPKVTSIKEAAARTAEGRPNEEEDLSAWLTEASPAANTLAGQPTVSETLKETRSAAETEEIQLETTIIDDAMKKPAQPAVPASSPEPAKVISAPPEPAPVIVAPPEPAPAKITPSEPAPLNISAEEFSVVPAPKTTAAPVAKQAPPSMEVPVYDTAQTDETDVSSGKPGKQAPGKPGKLPKLPRQTNDSREAAADVLRKLFHRR